MFTALSSVAVTKRPSRHLKACLVFNGSASSLICGGNTQGHEKHGLYGSSTRTSDLVHCLSSLAFGYCFVLCLA